MLHVIIRSRALDFSSRPPSFDPLPSGPALPSFLPACNGQLQQDLSDGAGWFLPHVRIINVKVVESYPASRRVVVILSLPRSPCSARRSVSSFPRPLALGPALILGNSVKPPVEESRARSGRSPSAATFVLLRRWQGSVVWAQPRILASTPRRRIQQFPLLHPRTASLGCAQQACHPSGASSLWLLYV